MSRSILTALAAVLTAALGCGQPDMNSNTAAVGASPAYTPASDAVDTRPLNANI